MEASSVCMCVCVLAIWDHVNDDYNSLWRPIGTFVECRFIVGADAFPLRCIKLCHPSRLTRHPNFGLQSRFHIFVQLYAIKISYILHGQGVEQRIKKIKYIFRHSFRCASVLCTPPVRLFLTCLIWLELDCFVWRTCKPNRPIES